MMWQWLEDRQYSWWFVARVVAKAAILLAVFNYAYALLPDTLLSHVSLYNVIFPGRERFPQSNIDGRSFNIDVYDIPTLFGSHVVADTWSENEYRVFIMGDSGTWGTLLDTQETYAERINSAGARLPDGRPIVAYNLGYPGPSAMKELLILDEALHYDPDMIIYNTTLNAIAPKEQFDHIMVEQNWFKSEKLIQEHNIRMYPFRNVAGGGTWMPPEEERLLHGTLFQRRRDIRDWVHVQMYALPWGVMRQDTWIPTRYRTTRNDFRRGDRDWLNIEPNEITLEETRDELAIDILQALRETSGDMPFVIINQPMFIADGRNSRIRYNSTYPRWAYDPYRRFISHVASNYGWHYYDYWDAIPKERFTNSPFHLDTAGAQQYSEILLDVILEVAAEQP